MPRERLGHVSRSCSATDSRHLFPQMCGLVLTGTPTPCGRHRNAPAQPCCRIRLENEKVAPACAAALRTAYDCFRRCADNSRTPTHADDTATHPHSHAAEYALRTKSRASRCCSATDSLSLPLFPQVCGQLTHIDPCGRHRDAPAQPRCRIHLENERSRQPVLQRYGQPATVSAGVQTTHAHQPERTTPRRTRAATLPDAP
ncbi:hypothetical protein PLICRDRAFT_201406 [Plicaturopsis crispa FD-325 SS-3]|nr:hypothetical protein PLICRDRAFT_201406 [Plicaturopsis crispa FD-325 SS-3]